MSRPASNGASKSSDMRGIRRKKVGANDLAYSAGDSKLADIKASVTEHGYQVKLVATFNYNAMTERQGQHAHKLLFTLITDALSAAQEKRKANIPLFPIEDLDMKTIGGEGINTL
jgi:hypothetical protein